MRDPVFRLLPILLALSALVQTGARAGDYDYTSNTTVDATTWVEDMAVNVTDATVFVEYNDPSPVVMGRLTITANGSGSRLETTKSGTIQFSGITLSGAKTSAMAELVITEGTIAVATGGSSTIGDYSEVIIGTNGRFDAGFLTVGGTNSSLTNSGYFSAGRLNINNSGAAVIHNAGSFDVTGMTTITQGSLTLKANATLSGATISGGTLGIDSGVSVGTSRSIAVEGGTLTMGAGSTLTGTVEMKSGTFTVSGGTGTTRVGTLVTSGGTTSIGTGATLEVSNLTLSNGVVNLNGELIAAPALSGGTPVAWNGTVNMNSGKMTLSNSAQFTGGGIVVQGTGNTITMSGANKTLSVGGNGRLDAEAGTLTITGDLHLGAYNIGRDRDDFVYRAGLDASGNVNKVIVDGNLSVDSKTKVSVSSSLLQRLQSNPGEVLNILESVTVSDVDSFSSTVVSTVFKYDIYLEEGGANGTGMFIGNFSYFDDDTVLANLIEKWNPRLNNQAGTVISGQFANAIIQGTRLYLGDDRDNLSPAGLFNAGVLYSLSDPDLSGIGADALRYYNGSQAANMSEAALSITRHVMTSLDDRNAYLRRMQVLIADAMGAGQEQAYGDCILDDGFCPDRSKESVYYPATRIWATALGMRDKRSDDGVVTGFNYHGRGMTVGGDHIFGALAVGAAFSYVGGDYTDAASLGDSSTLDAYHFNLYGTYSHASGFYLSGTLGYAWTDHRLDDRRFLLSGDAGLGEDELVGSLGTASADYQTGIWTGSLAAGYDFLVGDFLTVSPSIGVAFRAANGDSHSEYFTSENGSANTLELGKVKNSSVTMPIKLAAAYDLFGDEHSLMTVTGSVGYAYDFKKRGARGDLTYAGLENIGSVPIFSSDRGRHAFSVAAGVRYIYRNLEFAVDYEYEGRKKFSSHSFSGSVGLTF